MRPQFFSFVKGGSVTAYVAVRYIYVDYYHHEYRKMNRYGRTAAPGTSSCVVSNNNYQYPHINKLCCWYMHDVVFYYGWIFDCK